MTAWSRSYPSSFVYSSTGKMLRLVVLSVLAAVALSQAPTPCETPTQWTANFFEVDPSKLFEVYGQMTYDAVNQRIRTLDFVDFEEQRDIFNVILLYQQQIGYRVNIFNESCQSFKLTTPFRPFEIPKTATFLGEAYLGSSESDHAGIKVQHWEDRSTDAVWFGAFTVAKCIPVQDVFITRASGFVHLSILNVKAEIDPDVFKVPSTCQ